MSDKQVNFIVGLGNPGEKYLNNRHNVGFMLIDVLSDFYSISISKKKFDALFGRRMINGSDVILVKPMAFMNRSGVPVQKLSNFFSVNPHDILIVHDDIDLEFGRLKFKQKGGHGGHNGIRSLCDVFGGKDFNRLRIGVGRPDVHGNVSKYVLGDFSEKELLDLDNIINVAKDAAVAFLQNGIDFAMNKYHSMKL